MFARQATCTCTDTWNTKLLMANVVYSIRTDLLFVLSEGVRFPMLLH